MRNATAVTLWIGGLGLLSYGAVVTSEGAWGQVSLTLGGLAFGAVGVILAIRTSLVTGWLFLAIQASMGAVLSDLGTPGSELMLLVAAVMITFPAGRLPSRRWRWGAGALALAGIAWLVFDLLELIPGDDYAWLAFMVLVVPVTVASAVRIVNDYRRAEGDTRLQVKWLAWVLSLGGVILLASQIPLPYIDDAHDLAGLILLVGSPIAIGVGVAKYRLYDIDRIVSRTLSYALVVAFLGLAVAAMAALVGSQFSEPWVVAATTLSVAALFNPLRKRVQRSVDRRFNRSKYVAEEVVGEFALSLSDEVDVEDLVEGWIGVVSQIMHPTATGVWIAGARGRGGSRPIP